MFSQNQLLFISLTRSIKIKPGSAKSYVLLIITSHKRRALMVLYTRQATLPASTPSNLVRYLPFTGHSRQTTWATSLVFKPSIMASFSVTGNASFHSASAFTASINSLVIKQLKLNWRKRPFSRLALIKSVTSGWLISNVAICAPRRPPADDTVKHILS